MYKRKSLDEKKPKKREKRKDIEAECVRTAYDHYDFIVSIRLSYRNYGK